MPQICKGEGCKKNALYNINGEKPLFCREHKSNNMVNVKSKKCIKCNIKEVSFGLEGDTLTHCGDCRTDIMVSKSKKCIKCNIKQSSYGLEKGKPTHCIDCKSDIMSNVITKKCIKCNIKQATFGLEKGKPTHCNDCRSDNMNNVKSNKCIKCNIKRPTFGLEGQKSTHCGDCRTDIMVSKSKKCIKCNIKQPCYGLINGSPTHCFDCKEDEMVNIKSKICITELCNTQVGNKFYEGYCAYCYGNLHPDSPMVKNFKTKERLVVDYIRNEFLEYTWKFDRIIENGCSRRRPDIFLDLGYQVIIIEIDENQHSDYDCSCENKRLMELSQDIGHRSLIFIRFNPDKYYDKENKKIPSCFSITQKTGALKINNKNKWNDRLSNLKTQIDYWIQNQTDKTIEIIQLYYDEN